MLGLFSQMFFGKKEGSAAYYDFILRSCFLFSFDSNCYCSTQSIFR